jgi:peptidoglycan/xylan/chitin deacetylase (PgdA/CDA1 family)
MRKLTLFILTSTFLLFLIGCEEETVSSEEDEKVVASNEVSQEAKDVVIEEYDGEPVDTYDVIYTLDEVLSLTFDRVLSKEELTPLLDKLDEYQIEATFFGSTEQLKMNPEAVEEIVKQGHQIENHALYGMDMEILNYDDIYRLIKLTNDQIESMTGKQANYVYMNSKKEYDDVNAVADQLGMSGVINHSSKLKSDKDDEEKLRKDMKQAIALGGILSMNPEDADIIPNLMEAVEEVNFNFVLLDDLLDLDEERKPFEEIAGADAIQVNPDMANVEPFLHYQEETDKKEVALTFDDWASEAVVLEVLNILDRYDIQSTFYLKTENVSKNPNLARLLIERGHEVANHTHSHLDSTTISPEELQEDVYESHKIITEAIQEQPTLYFRPPFGKIDEQSARAITAMGFDALGMYDLSSYDWNEEYTKEDVINRVMTKVQPGSVIVMHILDGIHTPGVLEDVILSLQEEGYEFVRTSDWVEEV